MSKLRLLAASCVVFMMDDVCEACHHFNIMPSGWPGCLMNWRVFNRLAAWAFDVHDAAGIAADEELSRE